MMKKNVEIWNMIFLFDILFTCWETYWEAPCFLTFGQVCGYMECKKYFKILSFLSFFPHYKLFEEKPAWNEREYSDWSKGGWWRMKIKKKRRGQGRKRKSLWDSLRFPQTKMKFSRNIPELFRTLPWFSAVHWISGRTPKCLCDTWEGSRILNFAK